MKTILIEGIPGTGKTTLSEAVCTWLEDRGEDVRLLSETIQDEELFSDYWDRFDVSPQQMADEFVARWTDLLRSWAGHETGFVFDNALFNQAQYLMALDMRANEIAAFYHKVCSELLLRKPVIVFLEGHAETITRRIMTERIGRWTEPVIELIASTPLQRRHRRVGGDGLVAFTRDSMSLRRRLAEESRVPVVRCDVTAGAWEIQTRMVLDGLAERYPAA